jgi:hypothetical protein
MMEQKLRGTRRLKQTLLSLVIAGALASPVSAATGERESLEQLRSTTLSLIEALVQEGVLSREKADVLIRQAEAAKQAPASETAAGEVEEADKKVVRVQYVPEFIKTQLREEIKQEVLSKAKDEGWAAPGLLPEWLDRISFDGDLRLRYELDSFLPGNAPPFVFQGSAVRNANIANTSEDRNRLRGRARLGINIKINDWLGSGIGLTTGNVADPVSGNQTLNTRDSKFSFALDRVYLKAQPSSWATIYGGRFANPFFSTDLVWDPDLAFDGVAASFNPKFTDKLSLFSTVGVFPLDEIQSSDTNLAKSKWLLGAQTGLEWKANDDYSVKFGAALYDYQNVEGTANTLIPGDSRFNNTVLSFRQKGNNTFDINANGAPSCGLGTANNGCGLASKFRELNLTGQLDFATFNPVHVILAGDYVRNLGFDQQDILARTGNLYQNEDTGFQVRLAVGAPTVQNLNDWQVFSAYKRIEADAVLDAFTDSDFHLGGTDTKGWIIGGSYGIGKNTSLNARWFSADEISGPPLSVDVFLLDLNAKF